MANCPTCGSPVKTVQGGEGTAHYVPADPHREELAARNVALQAAVDRAYSAIVSTAYVGGMSEREAYLTIVEALQPLATEHKGMDAPPPTEESEK